MREALVSTLIFNDMESRLDIVLIYWQNDVTVCAQQYVTKKSGNWKKSQKKKRAIKKGLVQRKAV